MEVSMKLEQRQMQIHVKPERPTFEELIQHLQFMWKHSEVSDFKQIDDPIWERHRDIALRIEEILELYGRASTCD